MKKSTDALSDLGRFSEPALNFSPRSVLLQTRTEPVKSPN